MGLYVSVRAPVFWTCAFGDFWIPFLVGQLEKMRERLSVFFYWFFFFFWATHKVMQICGPFKKDNKT
jgi:hypothetical protein